MGFLMEKGYTDRDTYIPTCVTVGTDCNTKKREKEEKGILVSCRSEGLPPELAPCQCAPVHRPRARASAALGALSRRAEEHETVFFLLFFSFFSLEKAAKTVPRLATLHTLTWSKRRPNTIQTLRSF